MQKVARSAPSLMALKPRNVRTIQRRMASGGGGGVPKASSTVAGGVRRFVVDGVAKLPLFCTAAQDISSGIIFISGVIGTADEKLVSLPCVLQPAVERSRSSPGFRRRGL